MGETPFFILLSPTSFPSAFFSFKLIVIIPTELRVMTLVLRFMCFDRKKLFSLVSTQTVKSFRYLQKIH